MSKSEKVRTIEKIASECHPCIGICAGKHCAKAGTKHIRRAVCEALNACGLEDSIRVELTKCQDYCDNAPCLTAVPGEFPYVELTPDDAQQIVVEHLRDGKPILDLLHKRARKKLKKAKLEA